jgi:hypothetical protein
MGSSLSRGIPKDKVDAMEGGMRGHRTLSWFCRIDDRLETGSVTGFDQLRALIDYLRKKKVKSFEFYWDDSVGRQKKHVFII